MRGVTFPELTSKEVLLLIGLDVLEVFWSLEERLGKPDEPYAVRTVLGWSLIGPRPDSKASVCVNHVRVGDELLEGQVAKLWQLEATPIAETKEGLSKEDRNALSLMKQSTVIRNGHYEVAMPWRPGAPNLGSNYPQALIRLEQLKRKFEKNARFRQQYTKVIEGYIRKGHARKVESADRNVQFFLPHHGVFHPQKPSKLRVVFDCAAKFHGRSLNDELLSGPDLMDNLVGVLFRFRVGKVAFPCDI